MAGGLFFLGQAVASATEGAVAQDNTAPVAQSANGSGGNDANVDQSNDASVHNNANAGDAGVNVGISNNVGGNEVNAGSPVVYQGGTDSTLKKDDHPKPPPPTTTVRVSFDTNITNNVGVDSTIVDSGNAVVAPTSITQSNSAPITQSTKSEGDKRHNDGPPWKPGNNTFGPMGNKGGGNDANVDQSNDATVHNNANAGDVGVNVGIDNNVGGNTVNCWGAEHSTVTCDVSFNTTINNNVDIRSIICGSGNAVIGTLPSFVCNLAPAAAAPAPAPVQVKPAANVTKTSAATPRAASAGKGELAFTGAETSLPLTLGLLALGMGGALTLAGRRRQTATV